MMEKKLRELYLDYFNNYHTYTLFAEHNQLDHDDAVTLIFMGQKYHEKYLERIESTKN